MLGEALSVVASLLWAASTILSAETLRDIDPWSVNALKILFASILSLLIAFSMGEIQDASKLSFYGLFFVTLAAIIGFGVGDTCLFKSMALIGVSRSYTIAYTFPLFTMTLGMLFLGEPFLLRYLLGTAIIFFGIVTVLSKTNNNGRRGNSKGLLVAFVTAVLWAVGVLLIAIGLKEISVLLANAIRFPFLFVFLLLASRLWRKKLNLSKRNLALLAASGIFGTLGGIAFLFSVQLIGVSRATPLSSASPVWATLMSNLFLKENVTWRIIASSLMVVAGIYFLT